MKKEQLKIWLRGLYKWESEVELNGTIEILCALEPDAKRHLDYFMETGELLPLEGDYPTPEQIRAGHPNITDVAIICLYDSMLKFDLNKPTLK